MTILTLQVAVEALTRRVDELERQMVDVLNSPKEKFAVKRVFQGFTVVNDDGKEVADKMSKTEAEKLAEQLNA